MNKQFASLSCVARHLPIPQYLAPVSSSLTVCGAAAVATFRTAPTSSIARPTRRLRHEIRLPSCKTAGQVDDLSKVVVARQVTGVDR